MTLLARVRKDLTGSQCHTQLAIKDSDHYVLVHSAKTVKHSYDKGMLLFSVPQKCDQSQKFPILQLQGKKLKDCYKKKKKENYSDILKMQ